MKLIKAIFPAMIALTLLGCGQRSAAPTEPTPLPTPTPPISEQLTEAGAAYRAEVHSADTHEEVYAMLQDAWALESTGSGVINSAEPPILLTAGERLFMLRGNRVAVMRLDNGRLTLTESFPVGAEWTETTEETRWGGFEKIPVALYATETRLVVVSDWVEYSTELQTAGSWRFEDLSYTVADIYDISGEITEPVGSFGQSGYFARAELCGDSLCLLSHQELVEADCPESACEDFLPAVYLASGRQVLSPGKMLLLSDSPSADYIMISICGLSDGRLTESQAVYGRCREVQVLGEELMLFFERELLLEADAGREVPYRVSERMSVSATDVLRFSLRDASLQDSRTVSGQLLGAAVSGNCLHLLLSESSQFSTVYTDETKGFVNEAPGERSESILCRSYADDMKPVQTLSVPKNGDTLSSVGSENGFFWIIFDNKQETLSYVNYVENENRLISLDPSWNTVWFSAWREGQAAALLEPLDSTQPLLVILDITGDAAEVISSIALGFDFLPTEEMREQFALFPEYGVIGLPAFDGYSLYACGEDGALYHLMDSFSYGGETGVFESDGLLFLFDPYQINVLEAAAQQWTSDIVF